MKAVLVPRDVYQSVSFCLHMLALFFGLVSISTMHWLKHDHEAYSYDSATFQVGLFDYCRDAVVGYRAAAITTCSIGTEDQHEKICL